MTIQQPDDQQVYSGLGILLPERVSQKINVWRRRYDPYYHLWAPHITLAFQPFIPPGEFPIIEPNLRRLAAETTAFTVQISGVGSFTGQAEGQANVLWLRPEAHGRIYDLRRKLEQLFPGYVRPLPFDFVPHVSIGFFEDEGSLRKAEAEVLRELEPMCFEVKELWYIGRTPGDGKVEVFLPLGGPPPSPCPDRSPPAAAPG